MNLSELLNNPQFADLPEEKEEKKANHRHTDMKRPEEEVNLLSLALEDTEYRRHTADPTPDLIEVKNGLTPDELPKATEDAYLVWCEWSRQTWFCPTKKCLNQNFIYREDLLIEKTDTQEALENFYHDHGGIHNPGIISTRKCYILDDPANESYEVYYDSAMPSLKYGKATPNGMFVHCYDNRFHRDMAILELDDLYSNQSSKKAGRLVSRPYGADEAIIVSDGAWMKDSCSASFVYLDNTLVIDHTVGFCPSEPDQAVLIAEITGATEALKMCAQNNKTNIKYYYDNTSILNVFKNHKTEYIREIKEYKDLLADMDKQGYKIEFIELHPKTGEERNKDNKALMFFHNKCDQNCRNMADIFTKDYRVFATDSKRDGSTYEDVKNSMPKPKNKNVGNFKAGAHGGNNKYGRRF